MKKFSVLLTSALLTFTLAGTAGADDSVLDALDRAATWTNYAQVQKGQPAGQSFTGEGQMIVVEQFNPDPADQKGPEVSLD